MLKRLLIRWEPAYGRLGDLSGDQPVAYMRGTYTRLGRLLLALRLWGGR